jgi:phosphonoacetaldehyde hydrolase
MNVNLVYDSPIIVIGFRSIFINQFSPEIILQNGESIRDLEKSYNLHQAYANAFEMFKKIVKRTDNEIDLRDTNNSLEDFAIGKKLKILIEKLKSQGIKIGSTTGYIDIMMEKIVPAAAAKGLLVDSVINSSDCKEGRPSPFMIFRNMENLGIYDVNEVIKVGDTVADVGEGLNAGAWTAAVVCSGNEIGLPQSVFEALDDNQKNELIYGKF